MLENVMNIAFGPQLPFIFRLFNNCFSSFLYFQGSAKASALPSAFSSGKKRQSVEATAQLNDIPDDTPEFNRDKVQLDIPDSLFQNSFQTVTGVTKIVGDLILVSRKVGVVFRTYQ